MGTLIALVLYVLQALGLYTIAKRRGIGHAWLAFIPFVSMWILGGISDDYKNRSTGKKPVLRVVLLVLVIVSLVLSMSILSTSVRVLFSFMTGEELLDLAGALYAPAGDLYAPTEEEVELYILELAEERMTDQEMEAMLGGALKIVGQGLLLFGVGIATLVVECMCWYNLFASCDPATGLLFFLVGLFTGLWGVFVFFVRNKDLGMPQGDSLPPAQEA